MADHVLPPPPSADKINLAIADLTIYGILLFPVIYITWRHGRAGMVCWPIFLSYFPLRFVSDAWQVAKRHEPEIPNTVAIMTNAGSIACLSLTLIGMVYEVYVHSSSSSLMMTRRLSLLQTATSSSPSRPSGGSKRSCSASCTSP